MPEKSDKTVTPAGVIETPSAPKGSAGSASATATGGAAVVMQLDDGKKKKKKRKYSNNLRDVQVLGRGVSKSLRRVVRATEKGLDRWVEASNESSRKKRDGALRDAAENTAKAVSRGLRELSRAPLELVPTFRRLRVRKVLSRLIPF